MPLELLVAHSSVASKHLLCLSFSFSFFIVGKEPIANYMLVQLHIYTCSFAVSFQYDGNSDEFSAASISFGEAGDSGTHPKCFHNA